jgi:hypothetical protein
LRVELASVTEQYQQIERRRNDYEAKVPQVTAEQQKTGPLTNVRQSEYAALLARLTRLDNYNKALVAEHADLKRRHRAAWCIQSLESFSNGRIRRSGSLLAASPRRSGWSKSNSTTVRDQRTVH